MPAPDTTRPQEIDHHTMKLVAGLIALLLGPLTNLFAKAPHAPLQSISDSYWAGGVTQIIFLGFLFATASFFLAYNGYSTREMVASKVAAVSALGVALFPCGCEGHDVLVPYVHYISAALMFLILAYFCYRFRERALEKRHPYARARAWIYAACGLAILVSIAVMALDELLGGAFKKIDPWLVFHGEVTGLVAFGVSWLTASRMLPWITQKEERLSLFA